ncbi:putative F-box domain-containing protein [Helianthus annuus]|uniref:F-box domain-containing protein n=1 Tax=Helianthus annuus TaxID=4232 RepID=A0A9K3EBP1_HELAN|nr:putative F-box domain-containing protein [Helianthus annuus]KAJ0841768.1 putative F-box domain-containing protein [Helianthus annuus]
MSNVGDDILHNILARLPGKPLLRFRCVSKHWNGLISDPYFMKSRSRRMILLPFPRPLVALDDNVPVEDEAHSMDMVSSTIYVPGTRAGLLLGSLDGYLCMVNNVTGSFTFDVWLMKEEGVWLKARSFRFGSEGNVFYPVCILGDGKILIKSSTQLVICDASKDSYKVLNGLATLGNFSRIDRVLHREYYPLMYSRSIEYVESLVSPSDMCSI